MYSIAFAIVSPLAGKKLANFGRRNFLVIGAVLICISNLGFVILHYLDGRDTFIYGFMTLRILSGIGTACLQTATYSIVSLVYPNCVEYACGQLEAAAGIGLCLGPIIGVYFNEFSGYETPFFTFSLIFLIYSLTLKRIVPVEIDLIKEEKESVDDKGQYSYITMLTTKRILFANIALLINIAQYTFIDPFLSQRLEADFGLGERAAAQLFFIIGVGYTVACQIAPKTLNYLSLRRCFYIFFIINGI